MYFLVWEGKSFQYFVIQQSNIRSVNFYGSNPSVDLAMMKIQEQIAAKKVSFAF